MNYLTFKFIHLIGILFLFVGIGGMVFASYLESGNSKPTTARMTRVLHGIGLLLILVGGVMMVYVLGLHGENGVPLWVKLKLFILVAFGPLILLVRPGYKRFVLPIAITLGTAASYLALFKPF